jgi:hypothetical protein
LAGETAGMRGGVVVVRGRAGERAGDRMRRGTIIIEGKAGTYAGSRMIAGTLIVGHKAGPLPGFLMKRGTIVLGDGCSAMSPTIVDCGQHELLAMRLWAGLVEPTASVPRRCCDGLPGIWRYWEKVRYLSETGTIPAERPHGPDNDRHHGLRVGAAEPV